MRYTNENTLQNFKKIDISSWEALQKHVLVRLMNKKFITEYKDIAYIPFLDLVITFSIQEKDGDSTLSHLLTNQELATLGVDIMDVKVIAMQNLKDNRERRILTLKESTLKHEVMYPLMEIPEGAMIGSGGKSPSSCGIINDVEHETGYDNIVVVSNKNTPFGASYMTDFDVLDEVFARFGNENFYIIPMSIHEIMCVKTKYATHEGTKSLQETEDDLRDMVETLNDKNTKSWEDILSYKLYYYYGDDGKKLFCIR